MQTYTVVIDPHPISLQGSSLTRKQIMSAASRGDLEYGTIFRGNGHYYTLLNEELKRAYGLKHAMSLANVASW